MSSYPLGGMTRTVNDLGSVKLAGAIMDGPEVLEGLAASTTYPAGMILARNVAGTKLTPYVRAGIDSTAVPVAVLDAEVTTDGVPSDVNLTGVIVSGPVREDKLYELAAGSGVAITIADRERCRQTSIVPIKVNDFSKLDN